MKIRMLKACATPLGSFNVGEEVDVPNESAVAWIKAALAEPVRDKAETAILDSPIEKAVLHNNQAKKKKR
jgi:hypothetical protein